MDEYQTLFKRNEGYVSKELQEKIRTTRILIAGCGIGSTIAEAALRLGFEKFVLADGDKVEIHNLNRQAYDYADIGEYKTIALAKRLKRINLNAEIIEHTDWITKENVKGLVEQCDFVFDTIDFLVLDAIVAVHDEARLQQKPIISSVSAGWGAVALYFPPTDKPVTTFRRIFGLPDTGPVENASYVAHFAPLIERLKDRLDPAVAAAMAKALTVMQDSTPCPAPHVSAGSYAVASLSVTMLARTLNGEFVVEAPHMVVVNMGTLALEHTIEL